MSDEKGNLLSSMNRDQLLKIQEAEKLRLAERLIGVDSSFSDDTLRRNLAHLNLRTLRKYAKQVGIIADDRKKKVFLQWTYLTDFQEALRIGFTSQINFYALFLIPKGIRGLIKSEIVYFGSVVKQTISDRLLNKHQSLKSLIRDLGEKNSIQFAFGWFAEGKGGTKQIDENLVRDIESMLIAHFKPRLNAVGIKEYKGQQIELISECEDESKLEFELTTIQM